MRTFDGCRGQFVILWFVSLGLLGCGGSPDGQPQTYRVSGTVTYQGKPVEGATVTFTAPKAPRAGVGNTDKNGNYELSTFAPNDGAVEGAHQVIISKWELPEFSKQKFATAEESDQARQAAKDKGLPTEPKSLLPERYSRPADSGLTANVTSGGKNSFDFSLKD